LGQILGIKIEQFIYTNINRRGRGIQYTSIDLVSLKNDFNKLMELFEHITPSVHTVFSKFNDNYYIYYQCQEIGFEGIGTENKKGRKGDIFIGLLIPLNIIEKLNYDFALVHLLLSNKIDWDKILTIIEDNNTILEPLNIEFNINELINKVLSYLRKNSSIENISLTQTVLKENLKIVSNPNIVNLMYYSVSLPKDIGKDIIFSTLALHHGTKNYNISIDKNIPNSLYYEQVSFLDNINKESYQLLKQCNIFQKDTSSHEKIQSIDEPIHNYHTKEEKNQNFKKILKISLYFMMVFIALIIATPFYQYYKLTSIYTKDITLKNLKNYRELIDNNGFLLNSFTHISSKYTDERENFFLRKRKEILAFTHCNTNKLILTQNIIKEYKKDKDIKELEKKYLDLNICMLNLKILNSKKNIYPFLNVKKLSLKKDLDNKKEILVKLKELIQTINEYRKLTGYKNISYYNDLIQYHIIYERTYFLPIERALKLEEKNNILEVIQDYEKHTILFFYKEDIQKIRELLKKNMIRIRMKIYSKKDKKVNIEYLYINNQNFNERINTSTSYTLKLPWNENSFFKVKDTYVFKGRLLKSINKKFIEKSLIPFIQKYNFKIELQNLDSLKLLPFNEIKAQEYINKGER
jgi:hypothetical protein